MKLRNFGQCTHGSDISKGIVLLASTRDSKVENDDPRNANLSPHLQVNGTKARVKSSTHEVIVNEISRHAHRGFRHDGVEVGKERNTEAIDHGNGHEVAIVVNDFGKTEDTIPMEDEGDDNSSVQTLNSVAVVHESLVTEGGNGETLLFETRKNPGDEELEEEIARIHLPGVQVRAGVLPTVVGIRLHIIILNITHLLHMCPHCPQEWNNIVHRGRMHKFSIVEPQTNPQVVHQDGETSDNGSNSPWTTELIPIERWENRP